MERHNWPRCEKSMLLCSTQTTDDLHEYRFAACVTHLANAIIEVKRFKGLLIFDKTYKFSLISFPGLRTLGKWWHVAHFFV